LHIAPTPLGRLPAAAVTPLAVRTWHASLGDEHPTRNKHAYGLLHAVMKTAVIDEILPSTVIELRRKDIGEGAEVITVARGATHRGECRIDTTKSGKIRSVVVPPHVRSHIKH
jgi:hypothetical protein